MMAAGFLIAIDIANRALQHCGVEMLDPIAGFTENSKAARQVSFAYDKLRRAELRRNIWRFATRRAALRAIDSNTLQLLASLWSSTTTYFVGSIVADQDGYFWSSLTVNNLNNDPLNSTGEWEPYFGPLTVQLYDSSQAYYAGELVYTLAGDGTYNTFRSLANMNAVHPALPNQWDIATTYFKNQVVRQFPAWAGGTTYTQGQTVQYTDGNVYSSLTNGNIGNTPSTSTTNWARMPVLDLKTQTVPINGGNLIVPPQSSPVLEWAQGTTYSAGVFVMFNSTEYLSIAANNTGNFPNASASTFWKPITLGVLSMSLIDLNLGNSPANSVAAWSAATTYSIGQQATGSDGVIYSSVINGNIGNNPITDGGVHWTNTGVLDAWTTVFTQGGGNQMWMQIGGASFPMGVGLGGLNITYPIGTGPLWQSTTRNVYRLPAGYLRPAPQDPKAGSTSWLGAPSGLPYKDWNFEGDYLVTRDAWPIVLRFIADVTDVRKMDDMFCEGLAYRIALEVCEPLTQSASKLQVIMANYKHFMSEAQTVSDIEVGPIEPPLDDYIAARL